MMQAAAKTRAGPTVMVAIEQYLPKHRRIIIDDLACSILPFGARAFVWTMQPSFASFTYVLKDFLDSQSLYRQERLHERYVKGNFWLFGLDQRSVSDFLDPYRLARDRTCWL